MMDAILPAGGPRRLRVRCDHVHGTRQDASARGGHEALLSVAFEGGERAVRPWPPNVADVPADRAIPDPAPRHSSEPLRAAADEHRSISDLKNSRTSGTRFRCASPNERVRRAT